MNIFNPIESKFVKSKGMLHLPHVPFSPHLGWMIFDKKRIQWFRFKNKQNIIF